MRTSKQIKAITSQVEVLEELRWQLENIETYIVSVMKKGTSWIEESDRQSYMEISQLLSRETAECIRRCSRISDGDEDLQCHLLNKKELCSDTETQSQVVPSIDLQDGKEHEKLVERLCQVEKNVSALQESGKNREENCLRLSQCYEEMKNAWANNSEMIGTLSLQLNDQEKQNKSVLTQLTKTGARFEEIMSQSQACSDTIKYLQKEIETLSRQSSESKAHVNKISFFDDSLSHVLVKQTRHEEKFAAILMAQESAENRFRLKVDEILSEISGMNDNQNKVKSQHESLCNKINENQERINEICGLVDTFTALQEKFKGHEEHVNRLDENQKKIEESSRNKMDEVNAGIRDTNVSVQRLQSESNALSLELQKLKKDMGLNVTPIKTDVLEIFAKLSTLKSTTDRFINSQTQKSKNIETKVTSIDNKFKSVSSQIDIISKEILDYQVRYVTEAFCAQIEGNFKDRDVYKDQIFTFFNKVVNVSNSSPSYCPQTGVYKVPCDGLYLAGLIVESINDVKVSLNMYRKDRRGQEIPTVFSHSHARDTVGCVVVPVTLYKDDQLYVKPRSDLVGVSLGLTSFFSCILLNKF